MELEFTNSWVKSPHLNYSSVATTEVVPKPGLMDSLLVCTRQMKGAKNSEDQVYRFHVAVEGAAGAGKTRFIRTLLGVEGKSGDYLPTHGVAVHQVSVTIEYKGEPLACCVSLWECGAYFSRKYEYVQESIGRDQDATIHVLSILDRASFQELLERHDPSPTYTCLFLSKTDLSMQTNIFPSELPQLQRDLFTDHKLVLAHVCAKLLARQGL